MTVTSRTTPETAAPTPRSENALASNALATNLPAGEQAPIAAPTPVTRNVYLSGPMTGIPEFNYPAFRAAAAALTAADYSVWNPADYTGLDTTGMSGTERTAADDARLANFDLKAAFAEYSRIIIFESDAVAVLPGWSTSKGAKAEVALAQAIGKPVIDALTGLPVPTTTTTTDAVPAERPSLYPGSTVRVDATLSGGMIRSMTDPYRGRPDDAADASAAADEAADVVGGAAGDVAGKGPVDLAAASLPDGTPLLIGLAGYAQTGKDTTALALGRLYGHTQTSPSDILREFLYAQDIVIPADRRGFFGSRFGARLMTRLFGQRAISLNALVDEHGWEIARRIHPYIRGLQQRTGTEAGRNVIDPDVWADAVMRRMSDGGAYVSTSVRFINEAEDIVKRGGAIIRIHRPGVEAVNAHVSDTIMDAWDYGEDIIVNSGSLEDLEVEVARVVGNIAARRRAAMKDGQA